MRGGKLYNAGDNAATRRGGTPDIAAEYLRRGSREYWRLRPRENGGAAALEFDWESWSRDVPRERYFVELLCDPGDVAAAAPVREALRRFGYYQSFRVRAPDALALTAREGGDYEASR